MVMHQLVSSQLRRMIRRWGRQPNDRPCGEKKWSRRRQRNNRRLRQKSSQKTAPRRFRQQCSDWENSSFPLAIYSRVSEVHGSYRSASRTSRSILHAAAMSWRKRKIEENGQGISDPICVVMAMVGNFSLLCNLMVKDVQSIESTVRCFWFFWEFLTDFSFFWCAHHVPLVYNRYRRLLLPSTNIQIIGT